MRLSFGRQDLRITCVSLVWTAVLSVTPVGTRDDKHGDDQVSSNKSRTKPITLSIIVSSEVVPIKYLFKKVRLKIVVK